MLSRPQQILIKRAQREALLGNDEYRDALEAVCGCRSSTDSKMTDRNLDIALAYFEAIFWRKVDLGQLQPSCKPDAVFRQRGFWAGKNTHQETSRDRYASSRCNSEIEALEAAMSRLGFGDAYCEAIRRQVTEGRTDPHSLHIYLAALQRTLKAKQKKLSGITPAHTGKV